MKSPCIKVCRLDGEICVGCGRTLGEIKEWTAASEERKREIVNEAEKRYAIRQS